MRPGSGARLPCAVLGAGGYIGQTFAARLAEHPWFDVPRLVGGERSVGRPLEDRWLLGDPPSEALAGRRIESMSPGALARSGVRVAFSGLPSGTAGPFERELARRGIAVFSNAADLRGISRGTHLIPEVNPGHFRPSRGSVGPIVTNPNCSATGLALALAPLVPLLEPVRVHVATYQAISGAGYPGVPSLAVTDNVLPFIEHEEEKLSDESRRLLGTRSVRGPYRPAPFAVLAQCARVGTREGHLEAVTVEARRRPTLAEITRAIRAFDPLAGRPLPSAPHPPLVLRAEADRPQPLLDRYAGGSGSTRGMAVSLGRLRWSPPFLRFFLLVHNAVRGGAGGSILNAEFVLDGGGWTP